MQWFPRVSLLAPSLLWSGPCGLFPQKYCLIISLYSGRKIHCSPLIKNKVQTPLQASLRQTFICLSVLPPTRPPHKPSTPTHALQVWWKVEPFAGDMQHETFHTLDSPGGTICKIPLFPGAFFPSGAWALDRLMQKPEALTGHTAWPLWSGQDHLKLDIFKRAR